MPRSLWICLFLLLTVAGWAQTEPSRDEQLTSQLRQAFRQVDGMSKVTLEVRGGVVVLRGSVPSLEAKLRAGELAERADGVLTVDNGISIETGVENRLTPAWTKLRQRAELLLTELPLVVIAAVVVGFFWLIARAVTGWDGLYARLSHNLFFQDLIRQVVYFAVLLVGVLVALEILDATALVGAVLGTAGVAGIALGFAFRDLAENSLASVLLSLRQPFAPNDHVTIDEHEGRVVRLNSRATILLTLDGNHLRIPNATVFKASILNYTRNPERRFGFVVGVSPDADLLEVQQLILQCMEEAPGVMSEPGPSVLVDVLGDWTVNLKVLGWVDQREADFLKVRGEAIRLVKETLDQHEIAMPEQTFNIRTEQTPAKPKPRTVRIETEGLEPERHLEARIAEERQQEGDLLENDAPLE
ncbi:MAG: mechanosensitive ion channel [Candidatus Eremiobacteraeota bacterium]|nr:mechanosensitive ion channel [Candidatus Eremiobacteraeota bacterium]